MEKVERKSNLELLKIIAMLMICFSHVINPFNQYFRSLEIGYFSTDFNFIFGTLVKNLGWIADFIFLAITCYFMAGKKKFEWRKMVLYYLTVSCIFFCFLGIFIIAKIDVPQELIFETVTTLLFHEYWYIHCFVFYLFILPLLNLLIDKLPRKLHCVLNWVFLAVSEVFLILLNLRVYVDWAFIFLFIFMQFIMSYGKKYGSYLGLKEDNKKGLVITLAVSVVYLIAKTVAVNIVEQNTDTFFVNSVSICHKFCPVYYFMGVAFFLLFKNLNIKQSKVINYIASLSLIFYIVHQNKYVILIAEKPMLDAIISDPSSSILIFVRNSISRFILGIGASIIVKETIFRFLSYLINLTKKKPIENLQKQ